MAADLRRDVARLQNVGRLTYPWNVLEALLFDNGFQAVVVYRCARWFKRRGIPFLGPAIARFGTFLTGVEISPSAEIGPGLRISHGVGIVVGGHARIGSGAVLLHQVTLGSPSEGRVDEMPTLGDDVFVGAGAMLIGRIEIGDGVVIGPNCVVTRDIPAGSKVLPGGGIKVLARGPRPQAPSSSEIAQPAADEPMDDIDRLNQREDELYDQLMKSPIVELAGVVNASGAGAGKSRGQELWSLLVSFDAWRIEDGPIRTEVLTVHRRVDDEELEYFQSKFAADTVVRIRARVAEDTRVADDEVFGVGRAHLEEWVGLADDDAELRQHLEGLQEPQTLHDDQFGTFTFDRRVRWYAAPATWAGESIRLTLSAQEPDEIEQCLKIARDFWSQESVWKTRVEDYAVQELLPRKNKNWLDDGEAELSPEEFKSKMTLQSIAIYPEGFFEFWHDDGGLFGGHAIQISGTLSEGLTNADIPG